MNNKQAKKIRQAVERAKPDVVQMFTQLRRWPFRMRLQLAWMLLIGLNKWERALIMFVVSGIMLNAAVSTVSFTIRFFAR